MAVFRARQIARIRDAVVAGRSAMREAGRLEPLVFARAFVAAGGVQIPGAPDAHNDAGQLGERLLAELAEGRLSHHPGEPHLQRELDRAVTEAQWAAAQTDDKIVGFYLELPQAALDSPTAEALSHQNHGLGPGVVRKADVIVLQPDCDGARFHPVREDEIEC